MQKFSKIQLLLEILLRHPRDFPYRLRNMIEARVSGDSIPENDAISLAEALQMCSDYFGTDLTLYQDEQGLRDIRQHVDQRMTKMAQNSTIDPVYNVDDTMATLLYLVVRALQPEIIVETGVAYGNSSAHILQALAINGVGHLYSIDQAPLVRDAEHYIGSVIPDALRTRWTLKQGASRAVLPALLDDIGAVDLFVHDSLHTYPTMMFEFQTVTPYLRGRKIVLSDDVNQNTAFDEWIESEDAPLAITIRHKGKPNLSERGAMGIVCLT